MANNFEMSFDPDAWVPDPTTHPDRGVVQSRPYLAFDDTAQEIARTKAFRWPTEYTGSGTLKASICYAMASATSGNVDFDIAVEAISDGDATDTDAGDSFDTVNAGSVAVPGTAGYIDILTITLTNKDSVAAGDSARLYIIGSTRTATAATGDARVYWVAIYEEA